MAPTLETLLNQIDFDTFVQDCRMRSGLELHQIQDQLFEIIGVMLGKEHAFQGAFQHKGALWAYLRRATLRQCFQKISSDTLVFTLDKVAHKYTVEPEQETNQKQDESETLQILTLIELRFSSRKEKRIKKECKQLVRLLLKKPEQYIQPRKTGTQSGKLAFQHTLLSQTLGWPRRLVYERLSQIRDLLEKYSLSLQE